MRMGRINRDIGENGQQPTDYGSSFWDEMRRQTSERPSVVMRTHMGANSNTGSKPAAANTAK